MWSIIAELAFISGIVLNFWVLLSPTPWGSNDPNTSLLKFTPYNEPDGYIAPNPCSSSPLSNATVSITYGGTSNAANYSSVAVWLGPLGSCSRDQDGTRHCTKASYSNPQFNMTYIQPNSVFYPQNMKNKMQGSTIRGLAIWHCVLFALFTFASLPFWFPARSTQWFSIKKKDSPQGFMIMLDGIFIVAAITEFFLNFDVKIDHISAYNSIDNFYQPAPCGTTRPLKSGILLKAEGGKLYNMMWLSWSLIYLIAGLIFLYRIIWMDKKFGERVEEAKAARLVRDQEAVAAKQEKATAKKQKEDGTFRDEVEKEKERIRSTALAELKAEAEAEAGKEKSEKADVVEEQAPPYVPKVAKVSKIRGGIEIP